MKKEWTIEQVRDFVKKDHQSVAARMVKCLLSYYDESQSQPSSGVEGLVKELENIRDNYDHDEDAHKHNNLPACRVCSATKTLASYNQSPSTGEQEQSGLDILLYALRDIDLYSDVADPPFGPKDFGEIARKAMAKYENSNLKK